MKNPDIKLHEIIEIKKKIEELESAFHESLEKTKSIALLISEKRKQAAEKFVKLVKI